MFGLCIFLARIFAALCRCVLRKSILLAILEQCCVLSGILIHEYITFSIANPFSKQFYFKTRSSRLCISLSGVSFKIFGLNLNSPSFFTSLLTDEIPGKGEQTKLLSVCEFVLVVSVSFSVRCLIILAVESGCGLR